MNTKYTLEFIDHKSSYLNDVILLGDSNSKTLGHLPQVVYKEYAIKKCVLIVRDKSQLIGYCLIRKAKRSNLIKIAQLCVNRSFRGNGVADLITNHIKETFKKDYKGIGLNCRNDYEFANQLWKRVGFIPLKEKKGRAKKQSFLTYWYYSFDKPDLFSEISTDKVKAIVDINIIIKLRDINENRDVEIEALFSDSVLSEIEYCYAKETLFEILRDKIPERRKKTRSLLNKFELTNINSKTKVASIDGLEELFNINNKNDKSDKNQVTEAIAAGIQYFITTDEILIKKRDKISEKHPIEILSPIEFLLQIDNIINEEKYIGNRIAGTQIEFRKIRSSELRFIIDTFIKIEKKEKKAEFKQLVKKCCIPNNDNLKVITKGSKIIGVWAFSIHGKSLEINLLRIVNRQLEPYLFKQLITESIHNSLNKSLNKIIFLDKFIGKLEKSILSSFGFREKDELMTKIMIRDVCSTKELFLKYPECKSILGIDFDNDELSVEEKYKIERVFYPLKLTDLNIPTYIIPIKPYWASQLFDYYLASQSLFGAKPQLVWNRENVYYRSVNPNVEQTPSRIFWYTSHSDKENRSKGISGISYMDDVHINFPKELFRRFKKFGIYQWKNVYDLAKRDIENEIKVIEFSDTEVFKDFFKLEDMRNILGKMVTLQSPLKIDNAKFIEIYKKIINK